MPKRKYKKKTPRQKIIDKLDEIVSKIIRLKEPVCVICSSNKNNGAGHVFSRGSFSTRWDITEDGNVHNQCWGCNFRHVRDQYPYFNWYVKKFGQEKFDALRVRSKTTVKYKTFELEELYRKLYKIYEKLYATRHSRD